MLASYTRWRRYFDAQQQSPGTVLNGADFDTEYDRIKAVFDAVVSAIADVRRDDGGVKNASIGADQLKAEVISLLNGVTPMGTWLTATVYPKGALVRQTNTLYYALGRLPRSCAWRGEVVATTGSHMPSSPCCARATLC